MIPPSGSNRQPALDEESFQKLLEAAFVLQQHNERQGGAAAHSDFNATLTTIVETHKLIQSGKFDFQTAISLVADIARRTTNASGAAIGLVESDKLAYRAASGNAAVDAGTFAPLVSCVSADCFTQGKLLLCADTSAATSGSSQAWQLRDIKALVGAPVYFKGKIAGVLELRFAKPNSFQTKDVGTAQLMAGLVSEAMSYLPREASYHAPGPSLDSQEDVLGLEDLELDNATRAPEQKLFLYPPVSTPAKPAAEPEHLPDPQDELSQLTLDTPAILPVACTSCGHRLDKAEAFCGQCGAPRPVPAFSVQSKWASLWQMQQAAKGSATAQSKSQSPSDSPAASSSPSLSPREVLSHPARVEDTSEFEKMTEVAAESGSPASWQPMSLAGEHSAQEPGVSVAGIEGHQSPPNLPSSLSPASETTATQSPPETFIGQGVDSRALTSQVRIVPDEAISLAGTSTSPWTSAQRARAWLDSAKGRRSFLTELSDWWRRRRASVYVGIAAVILTISVVMFVVSLSRQPAIPDSAVAAARHRKTPPPPNLTLFEKFLVGIGLAEPPDAPVYMGNPNTQVWIDVHTALYYCPGAELYGKTQGGKVTTQRDAQQDQFQPADRKVCD